jgi:hypothetical protein
MLSESLNREAQARLILPWLAKHRPDLIFAQSIEAVAHALGRARSTRLRNTRVVGLGSSDRHVLSYLDERPELVGAGAVDLLAGMVYYHETGVPAHPRTTMIDGELRFCGPEAAAAGVPAVA